MEELQNEAAKDVPETFTDSKEEPVGPGKATAPQQSAPSQPTLQPEEWFKPDGQTVTAKRTVPKKKLLITTVLVTALLILGVGIVVVSRQRDTALSTADDSSIGLKEATANLLNSEATDKQIDVNEPVDTSDAVPPDTPVASYPTPQTEAQGESTAPPQQTSSSKTHEIGFTSTGCYAPANRTINLGDSILFRNNNTNNKDMWPASDDHPSHTIYADFDARRAIAPGGTYVFTFNKKGTWAYHDHLKSNCGGVITVV